LLAAAILSLGITAEASPTKVEVEDAADHHVSAQGTYKGGLPHSWEWKFGSKRSARNITGIAAHGLLAAHRLTGLQEHQDSAVRAAQSLVKAYDQGWKKRRPHTQDIEFLAAAGFIIDAGRWFNVTRGRYTPAAYVDLVLSGRKRAKIPQVAAWDIASAVRASLAVGQNSFAQELVTELVRRRGEWDRPGKSRNLARGSLLWALALLKTRAGLSPEQLHLASEMVRDLSAAQQAHGGWLESSSGPVCTQTTAYAILGLSRWSAGKQAAAKGRAWLVRAALTDKKFFYGGRIWATTYTRAGLPENNFNSEIQSEAMMALATGP
jgi:hypothetical protein